jgi:hypothetical protein
LLKRTSIKGDKSLPAQRLLQPEVRLFRSPHVKRLRQPPLVVTATALITPSRPRSQDAPATRALSVPPPISRNSWPSHHSTLSKTNGKKKVPTARSHRAN